ncbi:RNA polymerase sigma factor [Acidobacteria bacterium ACD]|nr:MAG: RNA polymerase sigma factor [Acidobacteriota bacterium]MDL1949131.1 RNA polymerase sigma factor [Acidobacteria bacterium ACD]
MTSDPGFDDFYRETYPRLWAFLVRTTREPALAQELAQESFVRLLGSRGASLPGGERRAYLFRIAENLARDAGRRRARERTTPFDEAPDPAAPEPAEPMGRRAAAALSALPERQRKLLWLAHVEGFAHVEIARLLDLTPGSVRVLLHRARGRFRELFDAEGR